MEIMSEKRKQYRKIMSVIKVGMIVKDYYGSFRKITAIKECPEKIVNTQRLSKSCRDCIGLISLDHQMADCYSLAYTFKLIINKNLLNGFFSERDFEID